MPRKDNKEKELHENERHEKKPRREKRRRRRAPVLLILILLLAAIIALLVYFKPFGLGGSGGEQSGSGSSGSVPASDISDSSESEVSNTVVIRIDNTDIFFDGEKCENAAELKEKITALGNSKEYTLDHATAIKSAYDEVKQVLAELENALDIKVDYNE